MTQLETSIARLVEAVPTLSEVLEEHVHEFGELIPHVFMGALSRFALQTYAEATEGGRGSAALELRLLFSSLEEVFSRGGESVQEMVNVSFLENIASELAASPKFRSYLGPALQGELHNLFEGYGLIPEPD